VIKLLFLLLMLIPLAIGGLAIWALLRWVNGPAPVQPVKEDTVPETVRTIAFIVLVILLFGVTSGFLGAA
jgi:hypothetical protein